MQNSKRVAINTIAQYVRTVVNAILSLITIRWILVIIGEEDFGIYTVIAGVTSMLTFITNTLVSTTQRYLSFYQGKNDLSSLRQIFSTSEILHIVLGCLIVLVLLIIERWVFSDLIVIPLDRIDIAYKVYIVIAFLLFFTLCASPFKALLIAHENIVYISVVEILDGIIKVILVLLLPYVTLDKLLAYSFIMLSLQVVNFLAFSLYSFAKFKECVFPRFSLFDKEYMKDMFQYSGWVLYGTACVVGRAQGVTILVNRFLGTIANAAYGLGSQISGVINSISTSIINAMRPQIVKAEGAEDRKKALFLTVILCKISYCLMLMFCVPCVFEMEGLLKIWLKSIPEFSIIFSQMAVICCLVDSMTIALTAMSEAVGNVKGYNLVVATLKFSAIPIMWLSLKWGHGAFAICVIFVMSELVSGFARVFFVGRTAGLDVKVFFVNVIFHEIIPTIVTVLICYIITNVFNFQYRFIMTFALCLPISALSAYLWGLTYNERTMVKQIIKIK